MSMQLQFFIQLLIAGIATGAIYALMAVGFALLWQTSGTINFAQGEFIMFSSFLILWLMKLLNIGLIPAYLLSLIISMLLFGLLFKRLLVDPLLKYGDVPLIIATIGLGMVIREMTRIIWGANALPFPSLIKNQVLNLGPIRVGLADLVTIAVAMTIIIALQLFLNKSFIGRSMEATAQNQQVARILGINVDRMILYTFLINAFLVTSAALLVTPRLLAKFSSGEAFGLIAFMAAIIGGFNQVRGALIGGFLIGIIDNLAKFYLARIHLPFSDSTLNLSPYAPAIPLILLIVIILFKPEGIFGRKEERSI
ncbi:MAG: branched-chain amino acid ABC transporter permease [Deinococcales bacterium]